MKVVIAGTYPAGVYEAFERQLSGQEIEMERVVTQDEYEALAQADVLVLRILKAQEKDLAHIKGLKAIIRWGVGYDSVDIQAAGRHGVYVCNTPGANAFAVAELTVMMMLALGRKLACHQKKIAEGRWSKQEYLNTSRTLNNKLVGIIGGGNIGRQVAEKVQAFQARVQYYDPCRLPREWEQQHHLRYVELEELLRSSDIVSIHVPLTESTRHMIGREQIAMMKDGAFLINVARGGLVDDEALEEAILSGKLGGAGIDTPEEEPPRADSPFRNNPNVLLTPHVGGDVPDVSEMAVPMICDSIKEILAGRRPYHIVNEEYLACAFGKEESAVKG